jgi:hypothetical protein
MTTRLLRQYLPILVLIGLGIWVLDLAFGQAIWDPNDYLLGKSLDALKNYFTPAWFLKYDTGTHFSGMNYPFGEHVSFTDNQPLFSWLINLVDDHIYPVADHAVAIFNSLIFWSLILSMILLYAIGRHYQLPAWYAVPVAIILALLTPQMHRFAGHYALAYGAFVPLVWWMLIRTSEGPRPWLAFVGLTAVNTLGGFIHPYYLLMGILFSFPYLGFWAFSVRQKKERRWSGWLFAGLALVFPLVFFQGFMAITDTVTDRPPVPSGFLYYRSVMEAVFLPVQGPIWDAWHRFFVDRPRPQIEAFAYVGLTATFVAILTLLRSTRQLLWLNFRRVLHPALPGHLRFALWASILVWLFSMALPFRWNMEFLLDIFTPLRQFRSLGRFAWVFYYVFTMYSAVYLYLIFRRLKQKGVRAIGLGMLVAALGLWAWEAAIHVDLHAKAVLSTKGDNVFANKEPDFAEWLAESGHEVSEFQAVLPLPSFFIGSDKFVPRWPTKQTTARVYKLAFNTGLPLACGSMSRTSLSESAQLVQILSGPYVEKEILKHYPNDKPLLILRQFKTTLTINEQWLIKQAELLIRKENFALYKLPLQKLKSRKAGIIAKFEAEKDSLHRTAQGLYTRWDSGLVYWQGFDEGNTTPFGEETKVLTGEEKQAILYEGTIPDTLPYYASVWLKVKDETPGFPGFYYQEWDSTGAQVGWQEKSAMFGQNVYQDYIMVDQNFKVKQPGNKIRIWLQHKEPEAESFLLRPSGHQVWMETPSPHRLMYNNFFLEND